MQEQLTYPKWMDMLTGATTVEETLPEQALRTIIATAEDRRHRIHFEPVPYELTAQCPKCKTIESLQFIGTALTRSRKFFQKEDKVYHDCGSALPCHLHR
jgi:hypothetical protein